MNIRFLLALLAVAAAVALQLFFMETAGLGINVALGALVACAFFLGFVELFILALVSLFLLGWQPLPAPEALVALLFLLLIMWKKQSLPLEKWIGSAAMTASAVLALYLIFGRAALLENPGLFAVDLVASAGYAAIAAVILDGLKEKSRVTEKES